ncbi:PREDICTED: uncharacterized protein LOC104720242 [Camelina sativa]|uniref:Uncharacterized protein LOC104720242 n=1 Tax=Camelina sativa TaxID=90675 RepID=A0ABM0U679_CAMSA|nr:PREDICTED: uncharacterized protein LOC104720242 [Camelina sativa]
MTKEKKLSPRRPKRKRPDKMEKHLRTGLLQKSSTIILYNCVPLPLEERDSCPFEDLGAQSGDDCDVVGDEDCDDVGYEAAEEEEGNQDDRNQVFEEEDGNRVGVEELFCEDFEAEFGEGAREEEDETDNDSGDDIFDDEKIPDPLSESEDQDNGQGEDNEDHVEVEDPEVQLELGKTFSSPEEFKIVVLRYSLKTRYAIKLYRSQSLKIGAKCANTDPKVKCLWRCYCSYNKKKHKMQIKVYESKHVCVRSGYNHMLKRGTIAWLFADRLRQNPKIRPREMQAEIKREYNLEVSEEQCSKAKTKVRREAKAGHQEHFLRIWDYQAEINRSNPGTVFVIATISGPIVGSLLRFYRLFVCFKSQRDTWKETCRPIIGVDGAFLKWDIKGYLLVAAGRDGDNRIVPLAWAVVEIENDDN